MPEWMRRILYDSDGGGGGGGTGGDGGGDDGGGDDSGGDDSGKKPPKSVPYARFREVGEKVKGLEGGLAERDKTIGDLTTRLETLEGRKDPNADPNAGTDDNLDPDLKSELDKRDLEREKVRATDWLTAKPEASSDPEYQDRISWLVKEVAKEYGLHPNQNPMGLAKLTYKLYLDTKKALEADGKGGDKGTGGDAGKGGDTNLGRVGADAARPLNGAGGSGGSGAEFSRDQIGNMGLDEYKKKRDKILKAWGAGKIA